MLPKTRIFKTDYFNKSFFPALIRNIKRDRQLLILMFIPILYFIIFHYVPMYGILIAFKDFSVGKGIWESKWVGFKWFMEFFQSYYFFRLLRNTFLISFYSIIFGFPVPIFFALVLNEMRNKIYKRFAQTITYLPHFISTVVIVGIMVNFLSPHGGLVNVLRETLGLKAVNYMAEPEWFRFLYISSNIWQEFGFGSIVYMAAISGIDIQLYDSASIDGATRLQKIKYITIPGILPTAIILLIMRLGRVLSVGFEKVILMYSSITYETGDILSSFVYRAGLENAQYSYASAVGLFNNLINLIFIITFNKLAKKYSYISLW